ncbi:MAG: hypothetical protein ABI881_08910 [Betaproteobacteria bacterium]
MPRVPAIATGILAMLVAFYWIAGMVGGGHKLAALEPLANDGGSYAITLAFAPERFHQQLLQDRGRVVGVDHSTVFMMDVDPKSLRAIAREYWVVEVRRWSPR